MAFLPTAAHTGHILGEGTGMEGSLHRLLGDCQVPVTLKSRTVEQRLRGRDPSWKPNSWLTPEPLGPGGGRPLSPGRASEHVQTGRPFARSAPAARSTPRPRLSSEPAGSATAQRGSPQPRGTVRRGPGSVGVLATGAGGVRASGLRALRGCGLGAPEGGRPSRQRSRGGDIRQNLLPLSRSVPKPGFRSAQGFLQSLGELEHRQRQNRNFSALQPYPGTRPTHSIAGYFPDRMDTLGTPLYFCHLISPVTAEGTFWTSGLLLNVGLSSSSSARKVQHNQKIDGRWSHMTESQRPALASLGDSPLWSVPLLFLLPLLVLQPQLGPQVPETDEGQENSGMEETVTLRQKLPSRGLWLLEKSNGDI
ncbi:uncharacterized protein LOC113456291 [Microtus ochrogaster]|uniref:Uncharacterized protein LOC113456291 n=1 Tax=Microtus ochrogaster TaxID=79684 RepID=A0ABM1U1J8_MICOH|nr:uncharacterized protein LOC113456291 [Microtus ochrogaster]